MDVKNEAVELKYDEFGQTDDLQNSDVNDSKYHEFNETNDLQHSDVENMETTEAVSNGVNIKNCCKDKCLSMFDDEFKTRLKSDLSTLSFLEKRIFLFALININEKKQKSGVKSKFFEYSVKEYGVLRSVCKIAFISIHNITQATVRNLCEKMIDNHLIPTDKRGKHENHHSLPESMKELIRMHLINTLESPDIFKCSRKRTGMPNIKQLWIDFIEKHHCNINRATYTRYVRTFLTLDVLTKFICANKAKQILNQLTQYGL